jgi:hypothetical protein
MNKFITMNLIELEAEKKRLEQTSGWKSDLHEVEFLIQSELEFQGAMRGNNLYI